MRRLQNAARRYTRVCRSARSTVARPWTGRPLVVLAIGANVRKGAGRAGQSRWVGRGLVVLRVVAMILAIGWVFSSPGGLRAIAVVAIGVTLLERAANKAWQWGKQHLARPPAAVADGTPTVLYLRPFGHDAGAAAPVRPSGDSILGVAEAHPGGGAPPRRVGDRLARGDRRRSRGTGRQPPVAEKCW